jgi:CoA:oxalate CoA-transferase
MLPLDGVFVLDLSQFLAGPVASLRLADLGARVVKVEHPELGDLCRRLYVSNVDVDGESTLFHAINRNKESFAANLKDPKDLAAVHKLIAYADVVIQNFRPGVAERLEVDHRTASQINPAVIYGQISGYGTTGPWRGKPGQDLLAQARSGLMWLNGSNDSPPTPVGLAVGDMLAGAHLAQGILACLVQRFRTGTGALVETSLLESLLDFQFEVITTHLNDPQHRLPDRGTSAVGHSFLGAPYGVYATVDGYLAIAMGEVAELGRALELDEVAACQDPLAAFERREPLMRALQERLRTKMTASWIVKLEAANIWCAEVLDWPRLFAHEAFKALEMFQEVGVGERPITTTRCPIRINGELLRSPRSAPSIGQHEGLAALLSER